MSHIVLKAALRRLEQGWCAGALARTYIGNPCAPTAPQAVSWSLLGALLRACAETRRDHLFPQMREAARMLLWDHHRCYLFALNEPDARVACWVVETLLKEPQ